MSRNQANVDLSAFKQFEQQVVEPVTDAVLTATDLAECKQEAEAEIEARQNQKYDETAPYHLIEYSPSWQCLSDFAHSGSLAMMCLVGDNTTIIINAQQLPKHTIQSKNGLNKIAHI
jgi:hypothetical protein